MDINQSTLVDQLISLGVQPGGVLQVHTAFSKVRPVEGGPAGLIAALRAAMGPWGTLVMPSMFWEDDQLFDVASSPCPEMGVVADTFWRMPGVLRSDSPHAFAAAGPLAAKITAVHPPDVPHGTDSPVGRVHALDGQVLLLGVEHSADTMIHLGETLAGVRYRVPKHLMIRKDGAVVRLDYAESDHCCENFVRVDGWLDEQGLQRKGLVGHATARLARARDIVAVVVEHLRADETAFLHPLGVDEACDAARRSIGL